MMWFDSVEKFRTCRVFAFGVESCQQIGRSLGSVWRAKESDLVVCVDAKGSDLVVCVRQRKTERTRRVGVRDIG